MLDTLRKRLRSEKGFTLIELLVVMIILAILTAIAIPSYLSFKDRANKSAAGADVRSIIPSIESYFSDNGTYSGMSIAGLQASYDQAINLSLYALGAGTQTSSNYCVQATSQNQTASKAGPSSQIVIGGTCP
jgi:type IV pilus assembly protein PilA